ncbi:MAG: hypothetical protein HYY49_03190 [Ignavibacteriales bacterium]|nr:hypothetical protein [Ignavibacteriales bacterium]
MKNPPELEGASAFKVMTIVFGALLLGQIVFLSVILVLHSQNFEFITESTDIFAYAGTGGLLAGVGASSVLYRSLLKSAMSESDLHSRIARFNAAVLVRLAVIEGTNFLNLAFYLLTGNNLFLLLFAFGFTAFILARPGKDTYAGVLQHIHATPIE